MTTDFTHLSDGFKAAVQSSRETFDAWSGSIRQGTDLDAGTHYAILSRDGEMVTMLTLIDGATCSAINARGHLMAGGPATAVRVFAETAAAAEALHRG